jgi:hypothetical protein
MIHNLSVIALTFTMSNKNVRLLRIHITNVETFDAVCQHDAKDTPCSKIEK